MNSNFDNTVNEFFRLMRDWYPSLPSAARYALSISDYSYIDFILMTIYYHIFIDRLRMLQRRVKNMRQLIKDNKDNTSDQPL